LIAPLDRIKILFQTGNPQFKQYSGSVRGTFRGLVYIWTASGVYGLFQGHSATLLRVFPYAAIKFVAYDQIRDHLIPTKAEEVWYRRIAAGSLAGNMHSNDALMFLGLTSVFVTYPLEVVRVRLAFETHNSGRISLRSICRQIYHERDNPMKPLKSPIQSHLADSTAFNIPPAPRHTPLYGIANFYRGFIPTIAGMIPYAGVSFWAHDWAGDILRSKTFAPYTLSHVPPRNEREARHPKLKSYWEAIAGGLAGLIAQTSSYPIEIVRRRMQVGGAVGNHEMKGAWQTVRSIYTTAGLKGFYIGLSIGYIKVHFIWSLY
jgi:solute carrier family 25 (mitochondrial carrier protein), member 16